MKSFGSVLAPALSLALGGCYLSHRIAEDEPPVDGPPICWTATAGPTFLTDAPPAAYAGTLLWEDGEALLGFAATNADPTRPRTLAHLDARGQARAEEVVFDSQVERQFGPALEVVSSSFGRVATAYSEGRGCELRVLGAEPSVITSDYCRGLRASPTGGVMLLLDGIGADAPERRFAAIRSIDPPRLRQGARGVLGDALSWTYEPLDRDAVVAAIAPREGGPIEAGTIEWRGGERRLVPVVETTRDVRRLRLLRHRGGWALGWIEQTDDAWRLGLMQLDDQGLAIGPAHHPAVGALPETGWRMVERGDEIVVAFVVGDELRLASLDADFGLVASTSTVARLTGLDELGVVVLDDGAVLVSFTEGTGTGLERVGTVRAECVVR
ncbi:MAG: hypothetical protein H6719_10260 [Sandaracinaceae bacterium]|nr:hypothetical protein [Sandaracinaceae bacterium]